MKAAQHTAKAKRIEDTMTKKLDLREDYETVVENCMLAGTHLLNAILHLKKITPEDFDLLHSDKPELERPVPAEVAGVMAAMKYIEDLRPDYVRGATDMPPAMGDKCMDCYRKVKDLAVKVM